MLSNARIISKHLAFRFVEEIDSVDDPSSSVPGMSPIILSLIETPLGGMGVDERVSIALIGVTPSTGDVIWDEFNDGYMRSELEVIQSR